MNQEQLNRSELKFQGEKLGSFDIAELANNQDDFKRELEFLDCEIENFNASWVMFNNKVTFKNCMIQNISCYGTYFLGGLEISNCRITECSQFDCGGHNASPLEFVIEDSIFEGYAGFFDIWCLGPARIINNQFLGGSNIANHLVPPYGIADNEIYLFYGNTGEMNMKTEAY